MNTTSKRAILLALILFTILLRLAPIFPDKFPFMYDHAKDALIILQMGTKFKPSLVGAVTSIPGLYYGPVWYYLALPLNLILNFHPLASVLTVILLAAANTYLAWKYLGKLEAVLWATSMGIIGTQTSAWSPYLTPLLTLPVLIILLRLTSASLKVKTKTWLLLILSGLLSLGFHLQPAYAIVLLPISLVALALTKFKLSWRQFVLSLAAFLLPFGSHLIFELRHNFFQTKQLLNFLRNYGHEAAVVQPNAAGLKRIVEIGRYWLTAAGQAISPLDFNLKNWELFFGGSLVLLALYFFWQQRHKISPRAKILATLLLGSFIFYLILPAKPYYFVALMPFWLTLFATVIKKHWSFLVKPIIILCLFLSLVQLRTSLFKNRTFAQQKNFLLSTKLTAIKKAYALADDQPFASYHFTPEIYDYTYQFLYRYLMRQGKQEPKEFSYAPGKTAYLDQVVPELVRAPPENLPAQVFLIVEEAETGREFAFEEWWNQITAQVAILDEVKVNSRLTIYRAKPHHLTD